MSPNALRIVKLIARKLAQLVVVLLCVTFFTFLLIRFMPGLTRIYFKDTFPGMIFDQIGIARPAVQDKQGFADDVTKERIPDFDGDRLFYFVYETGNGKASKQSEEWLAEPLWQNLPVVKAGKAVAVDDAVWNTAGGVIAANLLLDDIARVYGVTLAK